MPKAKTVADTLTGARAFLAVWILWLGINGGRGALGAASITLILAWATDILDGPIARRSPRPTHTWIGDHDLEVDLLVAFSVWVYLSMAGYVPPIEMAAYAIVVAAALWYFRSKHLGWGVQAVPYGGMILVSLRDARAYGIAMVLWIVGILIVTWPRFPRETVPEFVDGMKSLLHHGDRKT